jgi:hypothetical protein
MKLKQGQIWKLRDQYVRIVHLERLQVDYKATKLPGEKAGTHHQATKKEFCRLLKGATLLPAGEVPRPRTGATGCAE